MKKINILIVDDSKDSLNILSTALNALQYFDLFRAGDGASALKIYENKKIDISFLDLDMPPPNGMETLKRIREINSDAFVIIITASSDANNVQDAIKGGASGYIVKPFTPGRIAEVLKKYNTQTAA